MNSLIREGDVRDILSKSAVLIVDDVFEKPAAGLHEALADYPDDSIYWLRGGESAKQWDQVKNVLTFLYEKRLVRDAVITVIGGGTVCDVGAFAASIYLRGVTLYLVPTTLLSMVDASVGGKTGINFQGKKNLVGTFYLAQEVVIDTLFLRSQPHQLITEGIAEIVKAGLLGDALLLDMLRDQGKNIIAGTIADEPFEDIVWRAIAVKHAIVTEDPREQGKRAFLNLGHTFAHALEAEEGRYSHGIAVAWGLRCAAHLSVYLNIATKEYYDKVRELLDIYDYPSKVSASAESLYAHMQYDKKKHGNVLRFVLQSAIGETTMVEPDEDSVLAILNEHTR